MPLDTIDSIDCSHRSRQLFGLWILPSDLLLCPLKPETPSFRVWGSGTADVGISRAGPRVIRLWSVRGKCRPPEPIVPAECEVTPRGEIDRLGVGTSQVKFTVDKVSTVEQEIQNSEWETGVNW